MIKTEKEIDNNKTEINDNKKAVKSNSFLSELKSFFFDSFKIVVISLLIIVGVRGYIMQPFFVNGQSMEPNFYDKDYLIVNKIDYQFNDPRRGDVIVFHYPVDPRDFFIKRIIGLPGERVEITKNTITIYNQEHPEGMVVNEKYIPQNKIITGSYSEELKNDEYYVLGDNRIASADSRVWGVLEKHYIVGKAWIRAWPFDGFSIFKEVSYE